MHPASSFDSYIKRCFDLSQRGVVQASPNPCVGAVLVYQNKIIGEGFTQEYGSDHAEVQCINSVKPADRPFIKDATLFVSVEPCCIVGNTPACTDLIKKFAIKNVVFSTIDPTPEVKGKSESILQKNGSIVTKGLLKEKGDQIMRSRAVWTEQKRPYIILKFAQSADGFMGQKDKQIWLTNWYSKVLTHKWRSEVNAIMVGTNTAALDNPELTTRLYPGPSPLRLVLDRNLLLDNDLKLFDNQQNTWVICEKEPDKKDKQHLKYLKFPFGKNLIPDILNQLYIEKKGILMVEGGAQLLQHFSDLNLWDEARVFTTHHLLGQGILAPKIKGEIIQNSYIKDDQIQLFYNI